MSMGLNFESVYNERPMTRPANVSSPHKTQCPPPPGKRTKAAKTHISFAQTYPAIAQWVESYGWIEIGQDDYTMVRALDVGGMVWVGKAKYASLDELLRDLENGLTAWLEDND